GILLAMAGILGGMMIEGGKIAQIIQPTAAMIVLGGTIGGILISYPLPIVMNSFKRLTQVFFEKSTDLEALIKEMLGYAQKARKEGIISLDSMLGNINNPFLKKTLMLAIDGTEPGELRKIMELEMDNQSEQEEKAPQVFEAAGGYAPTMGIVGAVLGLIQVMQHLSDVSEVGRGIAVAFVATIYGLVCANLFFLPSAGKLKHRNRQEELTREMILEGVISILEGLNPRMVETKLRGFMAESNARERDLERAS
ncbi:MAG: flagellar motor protein, partial [Acidobacteriota bacterium]|nr:flagellar motor protein [Acidobacteriota bacterium]